jgi:hypothetical protein
MTGWIMLTVAAALFILLFFTRVGFGVVYHPPEKTLTLRFGFIRITIIDTRKKARVKKAQRKKKKMRAEKEVKKKGKSKGLYSFVLIKDAIPVLKRLLRGIRIDKFEAVVTVADNDPADAAVRFGRCNAVWYTLQPHLSQFRIRRDSVRFILDYEKEKISYNGELVVSARMLRLIAAVFQLVYIYVKPQIINRKKNVKNSKQPKKAA